HVGFVNAQRSMRRHGFVQVPNGIAVDFDCFELLHAREQRQRDRAEARTDLDDAVLGLRIDRGDDTRDHAGIMEEMLTEALARDMQRLFRHDRAPPRLWLNSSASSMAAMRLPGSALPLPASCNAVP